MLHNIYHDMLLINVKISHQFEQQKFMNHTYTRISSLLFISTKVKSVISFI